MTTFIPRRSARLATKGTGAPKPVIAVSGPKLVIEEIRVVNAYIPDAQTAGNLCNLCGKDHSKFATPLPSAPTKLTKEASRVQFLAHEGPISDNYKQQCVAAIKQYLDDCDASRGKTAKAVIATRLMHYLIQNPTFMAAHTRFAQTVLMKMEEFKQEDSIPDAVIAEEFHKTVKDVLYVVSGEQ